MTNDHETLRREVLEAMGWTRDPRWKTRLMWCRPNGSTERLPSLFDPAFAAELRAEMVRRGLEPVLRCYATMTDCRVFLGRGSKPTAMMTVEATDEPDPTRRECLATAQAFVAAVRATGEVSDRA